ncbi:hypothetical protein F4778DRAFT_402890 [Xylariomycetidae sp. FL2044]|nr:hypothetical protein F4778DRAFT_402890 [Xylariomycetidae sp. FL2044]
MPSITARPLSGGGDGDDTCGRAVCEATAQKILDKGFVIEYLHARTWANVGLEFGTGVYLRIAAGALTVRNVTFESAGVAEGLRDMAEEGLDGKMIIYGLTFQFLPSAEVEEDSAVEYNAYST